MAINFSAAVNAYNNAARISTDNLISDNATSTPNKVGGGSFAGAVNNSVNNSVASLRNAESTISASMATPTNTGITDVVMALTNAELTLKTVVEVRDRLVTAMQEIMKMPI